LADDHSPVSLPAATKREVHEEIGWKRSTKRRYNKEKSKRKNRLRVEETPTEENGEALSKQTVESYGLVNHNARMGGRSEEQKRRKEGEGGMTERGRNSNTPNKKGGRETNADNLTIVKERRIKKTERNQTLGVGRKGKNAATGTGKGDNGRETIGENPDGRRVLKSG